MDKVYFREDYPGCWWLLQLTDIFYFKTLNLTNNTTEYYIFSWSRNFDLKDYPNNPVRKYDVEIDNKKYYFLVYPEKDGWVVKSEEIMELDKLSRDKNLIFVGSEINVNTL